MGQSVNVSDLFAISCTCLEFISIQDLLSAKLCYRMRRIHLRSILQKVQSPMLSYANTLKSWTGIMLMARIRQRLLNIGLYSIQVCVLLSHLSHHGSRRKITGDSNIQSLLREVQMAVQRGRSRLSILKLLKC
jgi:hypothetical protein